MGTDVHAAIEVTDGNGWKPLKWPNRWHSDDEEEPKETPQLDIERNYSAFAILADVRNGVGFAGVDTGDGFVPIAKPRGFPKDVHPDTLEDGCTGDHTPTYLTADEILSYDWTRKTKRRGWVSALVFEEWDRRKEWEPRPSNWSGGISGPRIEHVSEQEMRRRVNEIMGERVFGAEYAARLEKLKASYGDTYCCIEWEEPYTRAAGDLWTKVVPLVMKLKREHKDVRLVMNFDS